MEFFSWTYVSHLILLFFKLSHHNLGKIDENIAGVCLQLSRLPVDDTEAPQTVTAGCHKWCPSIESNEGLVQHKRILCKPARLTKSASRPSLLPEVIQRGEQLPSGVLQKWYAEYWIWWRRVSPDILEGIRNNQNLRMFWKQCPSAEGCLALCGVDWEALHALEPLPVIVHQGDDGHRNVEYLAELHRCVKVLFLFASVELTRADTNLAQWLQ